MHPVISAYEQCPFGCKINGGDQLTVERFLYGHHIVIFANNDQSLVLGGEQDPPLGIFRDIIDGAGDPFPGINHLELTAIIKGDGTIIMPKPEVALRILVALFDESFRK